jgi:hypothetical protein
VCVVAMGVALDQALEHPIHGEKVEEIADPVGGH